MTSRGESYSIAARWTKGARLEYWSTLEEYEPGKKEKELVKYGSRATVQSVRDGKATLGLIYSLVKIGSKLTGKILSGPGLIDSSFRAQIAFVKTPYNIAYPTHPVKVGDTWTANVMFNGKSTPAKFAFEGISEPIDQANGAPKRVAVIKGAFVLASPQGPNALLTAKAKIYVNLDDGMVEQVIIGSSKIRGDGSGALFSIETTQRLRPRSKP